MDIKCKVEKCQGGNNLSSIHSQRIQSLNECRINVFNYMYSYSKQHVLRML